MTSSVTLPAEFSEIVPAFVYVPVCKVSPVLLSIWISPVDVFLTVPPMAFPNEPFWVSNSALLLSVPLVSKPL